MNDDNNIDSVLNELASISADPPHKRIVCERCRSVSVLLHFTLWLIVIKDEDLVTLFLSDP